MFNWLRTALAGDLLIPKRNFMSMNEEFLKYIEHNSDIECNILIDSIEEKKLSEEIQNLRRSLNDLLIHNKTRQTESKKLETEFNKYNSKLTQLKAKIIHSDPEREFNFALQKKISETSLKITNGVNEYLQKYKMVSILHQKFEELIKFISDREKVYEKLIVEKDIEIGELQKKEKLNKKKSKKLEAIRNTLKDMVKKYVPNKDLIVKCIDSIDAKRQKSKILYDLISETKALKVFNKEHPINIRAENQEIKFLEGEKSAIKIEISKLGSIIRNITRNEVRVNFTDGSHMIII